MTILLKQTSRQITKYHKFPMRVTDISATYPQLLLKKATSQNAHHSLKEVIEPFHSVFSFRIPVYYVIPIKGGWLRDINISSYFEGLNSSLDICCCEKLLKPSVTIKVQGKMSLHCTEYNFYYQVLGTG